MRLKGHDASPRETFIVSMIPVPNRRQNKACDFYSRTRAHEQFSIDRSCLRRRETPQKHCASVEFHLPMYRKPADRNPADDMHKTRVNRAAVRKLRLESGPFPGIEENIVQFSDLRIGETGIQVYFRKPPLQEIPHLCELSV